MIYFFLFSFLFPAKLKGTPRPDKIFIALQGNRRSDILMIPRHPRKGGGRYYTKSKKTPESSLQCHQHKLIYTSGNKIYWLDTRKRYKTHKIGEFPQSLVYFKGSLRSFIKLSPDADKLAWPLEVAFQIKSFDGKMSQKIMPSQGSRIIHPVSWHPAGGEIFHLTHNPEKGSISLHFRPLLKNKDRLEITPINKGIKNISGLQSFWSPDGQWFALNMDLQLKNKKNRRFFLILNLNNGKTKTFPKHWNFYKLHGFSNNNRLLFSGRISSHSKIYSLALGKNYKVKPISRLYKNKVHSYISSLDSFLLYKKYKKCPDRPRLISLFVKKQKFKTLLPWSKWNQVLASDFTRTWGLFRAGSSCKTNKPALYVMRLNGTLLLRDLKKRKYRILRNASPENVALCQ